MLDGEEGFQAALDADPADHTTRLVLADWLEERGDPRADGYRALGLWGRVPHLIEGEEAGRNYRLGTAGWWAFDWNYNADWWEWVRGRTKPKGRLRYVQRRHVLPRFWASRHGLVVTKPTRREAENYVAARFVLVRRDMRSKLLAGKEVAA